MTALALCLRPTANPIAIASGLDAATDKAWRDWGALMLRDYLKLGEDDVQQLDKVMAVQVALTNPDVFQDWHLFHHVCTAFNHRRANFEWLDEPKVAELAWTCVALRTLVPQGAFDNEVLKYLAANCLSQGVLFFPWIGGEGLEALDPQYDAPSTNDPAAIDLIPRLRTVWKSGELSKMEPSEINEADPFHVQLLRLVEAETYIRAQEDPNQDEVKK